MKIDVNKINVGDDIVYLGKAGEYNGKIIMHQVNAIDKDESGNLIDTNSGLDNDLFLKMLIDDSSNITINSNFSFISIGVVPLPETASPLLDNFSFVVPDNSNIAFMRLNIAVNTKPIVVNYDGIDLFSVIQEKIERNYNVKNAFKTIGVFGGSFSVISESDAAKKYWKEYLRCTVTNYGEGGAGYSSLQKGLQGHSIQDQVDGAGVHDIYILWASTNDFTNSREIGTYSDYTAIDNYDDNKLVTQCGGINYCIKKIDSFIQ